MDCHGTQSTQAYPLGNFEQLLSEIESEEENL